MSDTVGVNYAWPKALHAARKLVAAYDKVTFKASLFESEAGYVQIARDHDPELDRLLKEKGL